MRTASQRAGDVHLIEAHVVRLRALLEIVDLAEMLASGKLRLHGGAGATESLSEVLRGVSQLEDEMVAGGDTLAISILQAAAEQLMAG